MVTRVLVMGGTRHVGRARAHRDPRPAGIHDAGVSVAPASGLALRPLRETLADTF
ncbi:hypothetical protein [Nonomuraea deserti]|uniref:hypothetical protein n=1 Tax=Nonomuraea deserti TaxID=1848322 RepID=UPI0014049834|nr:hypothetical protein [Nonomuraea deserti]